MIKIKPQLKNDIFLLISLLNTSVLFICIPLLHSLIKKCFKYLFNKHLKHFHTAGSRTRTGTRSPPVDFESTASAIPPRRRSSFLTTKCIITQLHSVCKRIFRIFCFFVTTFYLYVMEMLTLFPSISTFAILPTTSGIIGDICPMSISMITGTSYFAATLSTA